MMMLKKAKSRYAVGLATAVFVCFACSALNLCSSKAAVAETQLQRLLTGKVIAVVDEDVITWSDIERASAWRQVKEQLERTYSGAELKVKLWEAAAQIVELRVRDLLLLKEARQHLPERASAWAEQRAEFIVGQLKGRTGSLVNLEKKLRDSGTSLEQLRQEEQELALIQELVRRKVDQRIVVSAEELRRYYLIHLEEFSRPRMVVIRQIFIPLASYPSKEKAREVASSVLGKFEAGADFAYLAATYSEGPYAKQGGLWPRMRVGDFRKPLAEIIARLQPGETSPILETEPGFHLIRLESLEPARVVPFEEAQRQIEEQLKRQKWEKLLQEYVASLLQKSYVRYNWGALTQDIY